MRLGGQAERAGSLSHVPVPDEEPRVDAHQNQQFHLPEPLFR